MNAKILETLDKANINPDMLGGLVRHFLTIAAASIIAGKTNSLDTAIADLIKNISTGDTASITSAVVLVASILWSMWAKASEQTKTNVVKTLTLQK
jgi:hypothetical protein